MALFDSPTTMTRSDDFAVELEFTETYRQHILDHPAIREAHCLRAQFAHLFDPIRPGDLFAGRTHYLPVGFGLEDAAGGPIYYCYGDRILPGLSLLPEEERQPILDMLDFWKAEATIAGKLIARLPARDTQSHLQPHCRDDGPPVRHPARL